MPESWDISPIAQRLIDWQDKRPCLPLLTAEIWQHPSHQQVLASPTGWVHLSIFLPLCQAGRPRNLSTLAHPFLQAWPSTHLLELTFQKPAMLSSLVATRHSFSGKRNLTFCQARLLQLYLDLCVEDWDWECQRRQEQNWNPPEKQHLDRTVVGAAGPHYYNWPQLL